MTGKEAINEYSAAAFEFSPINSPATMVEPERDTPGISAQHCARPITRARSGVSSCPLTTLDLCGNLSRIIIKMPTSPMAIATTVAEVKKSECSINLWRISPTRQTGKAVIIRLRNSL